VLHLRLIVGAASVLVFGAGVAFVALGVRTGQIPLPVLLVVFLIFGATEWFLWSAIKPPTLTANAVEVSASQTLLKQRMLRSDLQFIFRGQIFAQTRSGSYWSKTYLFVGPGGRVAIKLPASEVDTDGMTGFAQRLQVPMRGDFSAQVKDRVDPTLA
jgi:hypothetical protein